MKSHDRITLDSAVCPGRPLIRGTRVPVVTVVVMLGGRRIRFTDAERRRLARKAQALEGALSNVGHRVGRGTIANILREHGIEPAPECDAHTRWSTFLKAHWECLVATDFLSVEVCTIKGLVTQYILFFIDIGSRSVHIAGITSLPDKECRNRMIFFGQASLRRAITQYVAHYHCERNHRGVGNRLLRPIEMTQELQHPIRRRERLGGRLSDYHRQAA